MTRTKSSLHRDSLYRLMLRLSHVGMRPRLLAWLLIVATALCVAWDLGARGAGLLRIAQVPAKQTVKKPVRVEPKPVAAPDAQAAGRVIVDRNLFASTDVPSEGTASGIYPTGHMTQTGLQLELLGTVSGVPPYNYAIINDPDQKKPRVFKVGDQVRGATISRILRRSVVLMVDGREEVLNMKEPSPSSARRNSYVPPRAAPSPAAPRPSGDNAMETMGLGAARPHFEGGKMDGYYVGSVDEGSYLKRIGLQGGDIVEGLNDQAFTKPDDINQLQSLNRGPGVRNTLRIRRQGRAMTLNLD